MFTLVKELIKKLASGMSPALLAIIVILFFIETLYAAYRTLIFFNNYLENRRKNKPK